MSRKFRKKPVVIEAEQFINSADIHEFCGEFVREPVGEDYLEIVTLEGDMKASVGDWIIKGVNGEFYPCKPDIFEKTYDAILDGNNEEVKFYSGDGKIVACYDPYNHI